MDRFFFNARFEAKAILQKLDPRFDPKLYLVGFRIAEAKGARSIGVAPNDTSFEPGAFAGVRARAAQLAKEDPENGSWCSDEGMQRAKDLRVEYRALCKATLEAVEAHPANNGYTSFCGWPVEYDGFHAVLILQLQKEVYESHYRLRRATHCPRGLHEYRLLRSLIEAAAEAYLDGTRHELKSPNPGAGWANIEDRDHLLLQAAKNLMYTPAVAGGNEFGLHGLFDVCNTLSTLKYEGKEGVGRILIARPDHPHIRAALTLTSPVPLREYRAVRKLLQLADDDHCLLCDSYEVFGLGRALPSYDPAAEDIFAIQFTKQFVWDLLHAGNLLMHVRYGEPSAVIPGFPEQKFRVDVARVFGGIDQASVDRLAALAACAAGQKHGCMLVISAAATEEARRLDNQCTRVEPFPLTESMLPLLTSIDGSVLIDPEGACHAIGVILDGQAAPQCSPARGARYNSAIRYVHGRSGTMAVVKSEDGMGNIFPDLKPQVRRSDIRGKLEELRAIAAGDNIDTVALSQVVSWLEEREFYLTVAECDEANRLHEEAQAKKPDEVLYVARDKPLTPSPDMNESYYLPE